MIESTGDPSTYSNDQRPLLCRGRAVRPRALPGAPLRIDQRAQIVEPVRRQQPRGDQFPQSGFHLGFQPARAADDVRKKRSAALLQKCVHLTGGRTQALRLHAAPGSRRGIIQSASSRTKNAIGATLVGMTRRPRGDQASSVAGCGDSRPHPTAPVRHR